MNARRRGLDGERAGKSNGGWVARQRDDQDGRKRKSCRVLPDDHRSPASLLAPIMYLQLIISGVFGWWIFDQVPDRVTLIGMAIIAASGIVVALYGRAPARVSAESAHDEL